jgi:Mg2+/Co2+ transporter CorB
LDQWKDNLYNTIVDILDNYQDLKRIIGMAKDRYDEIGSLLDTEDVIDNLSGKKAYLADLQNGS